MIIGISGMIAAGKSSLSEKLHNYYKTSIMLHEFEEDDDVFNTFLKWLYENKPNLTIGFQSYIIENHSTKFAQLIEDFNKLKLNKINDHIFLDRFSVEHYIFAKLILSKKEKKYLEAFDALFAKLITKSELPDFALFLNISFDTFRKRIFQRGRKSEIENFDANYSYFKQLHESYFEIFKQIAKKFNLKYFVIDTDGLTENQVFDKAIEIINHETEKQNEINK